MKKLMARGFIQAVMLALLLNLSGHVFLHLGDAVLEGDETHFTSQQETKSVFTPQHQCSICQDHQHLSVESPSVAAVPLAAMTTLPVGQNDSGHSLWSSPFKPTRAPPRC